MIGRASCSAELLTAGLDNGFHKVRNKQTICTAILGLFAQTLTFNSAAPV